MVRVGIVGSRRRCDRDTVEAVVASLPDDTVIVSGGCPNSPDTWAEEAAARRGLKTIVHRPEKGARSRWQAIQGNYARNQKIVDDSDTLIAFVAPDRKGGTEDTIRRARKKGIVVTLA